MTHAWGRSRLQMYRYDRTLIVSYTYVALFDSSDK